MTGCYYALHPTFPPTENPRADPANHPQLHSSSPDSTTWIRAKPEAEASVKWDRERERDTHTQNVSAEGENL